MAAIENGNWIDIWRRHTLSSSLNDTHEGAAMNAYTTIANRRTADSTLGRLFRAVCTEARRALELVGASFRSGPLTLR
jgi:hypothetical protein